MGVINSSFSTRQKGITKFSRLAGTPGSAVVLIPAGSGAACWPGARPGEFLMFPITPNNFASLLRKFRYHQRATVSYKILLLNQCVNHFWQYYHLRQIMSH